MLNILRRLLKLRNATTVFLICLNIRISSYVKYYNKAT